MAELPEPGPQLDEEVIHHSLDAISSPRNSDRILAGAFLTVVDAFDRKVKRDAFMEMLQSACAMYDSLARLRFTYAAKTLGKDIDPAKLDNTIKVLTVRCESNRAKLLNHMRLMMECPRKGDKIN